MTLYCKNQVKLNQIEIARHLGGKDHNGRLVVFTDSSSLGTSSSGLLGVRKWQRTNRGEPRGI